MEASMSSARVVLGLTIVNLLMFAAMLFAGGAGQAAAPVTPVLRAQAIELVDARGVLRASLNVETGGGVILRMTDQEGQIRIKLGADRLGSALLLADDTTEVGLHLLSGISQLSNRRETMITLAEPDGTKRIIRAGDEK
jgi:hypothetical protein